MKTPPILRFFQKYISIGTAAIFLMVNILAGIPMSARGKAEEIPPAAADFSAPKIQKDYFAGVSAKTEAVYTTPETDTLFETMSDTNNLREESKFSEQPEQLELESVKEERENQKPETQFLEDILKSEKGELSENKKLPQEIPERPKNKRTFKIEDGINHTDEIFFEKSEVTLDFKNANVQFLDPDDDTKKPENTAENTPVVQAGWQTIMTENFEGAFPPGGSSWQAYDNNSNSGNDYWDDVNCHPHTGSWSAWAAATGDMPDCGQYDNNMNSWMVYGPFNLSDANEAELNFYFQNDSEQNWDFFGYYASINGLNYSGFQNTGSTGGWAYRSFDLTNVGTLGNLTGQPQVWIAFVFSSDNSVNSLQGAYVDDIWLGKYVNTNPDLMAPSASINKRSFVPGETIDIGVTVMNQGNAVAGENYIYYYFKDFVSYHDLNKVGSDYVMPLNPAATSQESFSYTIPIDTVSDTYYISYQIDAGEVVTESDETNNRGYWEITVDSRANLTSAGSTINKSTFLPGENIELTNTVVNNGFTESNANQVHYFLHKDNYSFDPSDEIDRNLFPRLAPGGTSTKSMSETIPLGTPLGTYYLSFWIDAENATDEINENDNRFYYIITIHGEPDLISSGTANTNVYPGDTISANITIQNSGNETAGASTVYYYFHDTRIFTTTYKVGEDPVSSLLVGGTSAESFDYVVPANITPGTYYLYYWVDAGETVAESNEGNNQYYWTITVNALKPDLTSAGGTANTLVLPGETITANHVVTNQGRAQAGASTVYYYFHNTLTYESAYKVGQNSVPSLAVGGNSAENFNYIVPSSTPAGTYYLSFFIDATNGVDESNEGNNQWYWTITVVVKPDLLSPRDDKGTINKTTVSPGETLIANHRVKNEGVANAGQSTVKYYFKKDEQSYAEQNKIAENAVSFLSPGQASAETLYYTVPSNTPSGTYYLSYFIDANNTVDEIHEGNNQYYWTITVTGQLIPDLTRASQSISPEGARPGETVNLNVEIRNQGNAPTGTGARITYYFHQGSPSYSSNDWVGEDVFGNLEVNQTVGENLSYQLPGNLNEGIYYFSYWIDSSSDVAESNEGNNQFSIPISIGEGVRIVGIAMPGASQYVKATGGASTTSGEEIGTESYDVTVDEPVYLQGDNIPIIVGADGGDYLNGTDVTVKIKDPSGNVAAFGRKVASPPNDWRNFFGLGISEITFSAPLSLSTKVGKYTVEAVISKYGVDLARREKEFYVKYRAEMKDWENQMFYHHYVEKEKAVYYTKWNLFPNNKYNLHHFEPENKIFLEAMSLINGDSSPYESVQKVWNISADKNNGKWVDMSCGHEERNGIIVELFTPDTIRCTDPDPKKIWTGEVRDDDDNLLYSGPGLQCMDRANLLLDYVRAIGLPIRMASGIDFAPANKTFVPYWNFHVWDEVFLPEKGGWYVFDSSPGRKQGTRKEYGKLEIDYFGNRFGSKNGVYSPKPFSENDDDVLPQELTNDYLGGRARGTLSNLSAETNIQANNVQSTVSIDEPNQAKFLSSSPLLKEGARVSFFHNSSEVESCDDCSSISVGEYLDTSNASEYENDVLYFNKGKSLWRNRNSEKYDELFNSIKYDFKKYLPEKILERAERGPFFVPLENFPTYHQVAEYGEYIFFRNFIYTPTGISSSYDPHYVFTIGTKNGEIIYIELFIGGSRPSSLYDPRPYSERNQKYKSSFLSEEKARKIIEALSEIDTVSELGLSMTRNDPVYYPAGDSYDWSAKLEPKYHKDLLGKSEIHIDARTGEVAWGRIARVVDAEFLKDIEWKEKVHSNLSEYIDNESKLETIEEAWKRMGSKAYESTYLNIETSPWEDRNSGKYDELFNKVKQKFQYTLPVDQIIKDEYFIPLENFPRYHQVAIYGDYVFFKNFIYNPSYNYGGTDPHYVYVVGAKKDAEIAYAELSDTTRSGTNLWEYNPSKSTPSVFLKQSEAKEIISNFSEIDEISELQMSIASYRPYSGVPEDKYFWSAKLEPKYHKDLLGKSEIHIDAKTGEFSWGRVSRVLDPEFLQDIDFKKIEEKVEEKGFFESIYDWFWSLFASGTSEKEVAIKAISSSKIASLSDTPPNEKVVLIDDTEIEPLVDTESSASSAEDRSKIEPLITPEPVSIPYIPKQIQGAVAVDINFLFQNTGTPRIIGIDDPEIPDASKTYFEIIPFKNNRPLLGSVTTIRNGIDILPSAVQEFNFQIQIEEEYDDIIVVFKEYITEEYQPQIALISNATSQNALRVLNTSSEGISTEGLQYEAAGTNGSIVVEEYTTSDESTDYDQDTFHFMNGEGVNNYTHQYRIDTSNANVIVPGYSDISSITNPNIHYLTLQKNVAGENHSITYLFTKKPSLLTHDGSELTLEWEFGLSPFGEETLHLYSQDLLSSDTPQTLYEALAQEILNHEDPLFFLDVETGTEYRAPENLPVRITIQNSAPNSRSADISLKVSTPPNSNLSIPGNEQIYSTSQILEVSGLDEAEYTFSYQDHGHLREAIHFFETSADFSSALASTQIQNAYSIAPSVPEQVNEDQAFPVTLSIQNEWEIPVDNVTVTLSSKYFEFENGSQNISLRAHQTQSIAWNLTPLTYGDHILDFTITSPNGGTAYLSQEVEVLGFPDLKNTLKAQDQVPLGNVLPVTLEVYNAGDYLAENIPVRIDVPAELLVNGILTQSITIPPHETVTAVWNLSGNVPGNFGYAIIVDEGGTHDKRLLSSLLVRETGHQGDLIIEGNGDGVYGPQGLGGESSQEVSHKNAVEFEIVVQNEGAADTFDLTWNTNTKSVITLSDQNRTPFTNFPAELVMTAGETKTLYLSLTPLEENEGIDEGYVTIMSQNDPLVVESVKAVVTRIGISASPSEIYHTIYSTGESYNFDLNILSRGFTGNVSVDYNHDVFTASQETISAQPGSEETVNLSLRNSVRNDTNETIRFLNGEQILDSVQIHILFNVNAPNPVTNLQATAFPREQEIHLEWDHTFAAQNQDIYALSGKKLIIGQQLEYPHVPGEVIIRLKKELTALDREEILKFHSSKDYIVEEKKMLPQLGLKGKEKNILPEFQLIRIPFPEKMEEALLELQSKEWVVYAEPNYLLKPDVIPNDPSFPEEWGLSNTGQTGGTPDIDIDAPEAWEIETGLESNVIVAVLDTGADYNHPDLSSNIWVNSDEIPGNGIDDDSNGYIDDIHGYDFSTCADHASNGSCLVSKNRDNDPMDDGLDNGHGTHVSGIIGATTNNNLGVSGVTWRAKIMPVKFMSDGSGEIGDAIDAIQYAVSNGAKVLNNSWGGGAYSQSLRDAIAFSESQGALIIASAGNGGSDNIGDNNDVIPHYPSGYDLESIISVTAIDQNSSLGTFANYGVETVDIAAPGVEILSLAPNEDYKFLSGTSMAAPYVSGVAALLWTKHSEANSSDIKKYILDGSDRVSLLSEKVLSGGRLNAKNALSQINVFREFEVHRSKIPLAQINEETLLATTTNHEYIDTTSTYNTEYYYAVVAVGTTDNRSQPSILETPTVVHSGPYVSDLSQIEDETSQEIPFGGTTSDQNPQLLFHLEDFTLGNTLGYTLQIDTDGIYDSGSNQDEGDTINYTYSALDLGNPGDYSYQIEDVLEAGEYYWRIRALNNKGEILDWIFANNGEVAFSVANISPTLTILEPDGVNDISDKNYTIRWTDEDADNNANIFLYYDTNNSGNDGMPINLTALHEDDEIDSYLWDTSGVPEGQYYVYGIINDGVNPPVISYSTGAVTIDHNEIPTLTILEPDGVSDIADTNYTVTWTDEDPDNNASIFLYYDTNNSGNDGMPINLVALPEDDEMDSYVWDTSTLTPGEYYVYGVIDDGVNSPVVSYSSGNVRVVHSIENDLILNKFGEGSGSIRMTATSDENSTFESWSGEGCSGNQSCEVALNQSKTVTGKFNFDGVHGGVSTQELEGAFKDSTTFIENRGQVPDYVAYYAQIFGGTVYVTKSGEIFYDLPMIEKKDLKNELDTTLHPEKFLENKKQERHKGWVLKESFTGKTRSNFNITASGEAIPNMNFFSGNDESKWQSNVPTFKEVSLGEVYDGIELKLKAEGNNVEKLFSVQPGADPSQIEMRMEGAPVKGIDAEGRLIVETGYGEVKFTTPVAFQEVNGVKKKVQVKYELGSDGYKFKVENYDASKELVIDPLLASTFFGSENYDTLIGDMIINVHGNIYITGVTLSSLFPLTPGAYDETFGGYSEAFISLFSGDLSTLLTSTYLGGDEGELIASIVLDSQGNVYVGGTTSSYDFPITSGAYDSIYDEDSDGFVSKLSSDLGTLISSTYIGGETYDYVSAIDFDADGNISLTGITFSRGFPTTDGAYNQIFGGSDDIFISKLNPQLSGLLYSTFLGGDSYEYSHNITTDQNDNIYIVGATMSENFPTTNNSYDQIKNGMSDSFITKISSDLSMVQASTLLGGENDDIIFSLDFDSEGKIIVVGETSSDDFPTSLSAYSESFSGVIDGFVSKFDENLTFLLDSTYLGGEHEDLITSLKIDANGNIYLAGDTFSTDFPTTSGSYKEISFDTEEGPLDGFISILDRNFSDLKISTFLGGNSPEVVYAFAMDNQNNVYVAGNTYSSDFPTTLGAYRRDFAPDELNTFISKLDKNLSADINLTVHKTGTGNGTFTLTALPDATSTFVGWSGSGCTGIETCTVSMDQFRRVTAAFELIPNESPTLTILEPNGIDDTADLSFPMTWADSDPDDDAKIFLFYDTNNVGNDGIFISGNISEDDQANRHIWNTSSLFENSYYTYGLICDGTNPPLMTYSSGPVTVSHTECTESDWSFSITPRSCPSSGIQVKTWTKIKIECSGGAEHPEQEELLCNAGLQTSSSAGFGKISGEKKEPEEIVYLNAPEKKAEYAALVSLPNENSISTKVGSTALLIGDDDIPDLTLPLFPGEENPPLDPDPNAPPQSADLAIKISSSVPIGTSPKVRDIVTYGISYSNRGNIVSEGVIIKSIYDAQKIKIRPASLPAICSDNTIGTITCQVGNLPAGAKREIRYRAQLMSRGRAVTTAKISSKTADPNLQNNTARVAFTVIDPPRLVTPISDQTRNENTVFSLNIAGNFAAETAYAISGANFLTIDAQGLISGTLPSLPNDASYTVTVTALNIDGQVTDSFVLTVKNVPMPPVLVNPIPDQTKNENTTFSLNVSGNFDRETSYTMNGATFLSINAQGVISGTLPNVTQDTNYTINVTALNGDGNISDSFVLTVKYIPVPPALITLIPDQSANENTTFSLDVSGNFWGETSYNLSGATFLNISPQGVISGTLPNIAQNTNYTINVTALNAEGSVSDSFVLTVRYVPVPPTLVAPIPDQSGNENTEFSLNVAANFNLETSYTLSGA
ncbi:S8 family serine peptidase, partial [Candidatus Peregrinibacteria bacterium]|nr:S8 family serine peptidase [Candidatus Peregrinibacteria bacterium]